MDLRKVVPITLARKKIFSIAEEVQSPDTHYILTEKGRPKAVVMSAHEFESWKETVEIMQEFPDIEEDVADADTEFKQGNYITLDSVLAKEGLILMDKKQARKYVRNRTVKKSSKRPQKNRAGK